MSRFVTLRPEAVADAQAAYDWYEAAQPGLGDEFLTALDEAMGRACEHPAAYRVMLLDVRRVLLRRFPYAAYFFTDDERVVVLAVFHGARDVERLTDRR